MHEHNDTEVLNLDEEMIKKELELRKRGEAGRLLGIFVQP